MQRTEVLAGNRRDEHTAQRLTSTTFGSHTGSQSMGLAERRYGTAPLVAGAGPDVSRDLSGEGAYRALMLEAVAVFVGTLAAGVVAIQARSSRSVGDGELGGTP
jgi:hypothetical protein